MADADLRDLERELALAPDDARVRERLARALFRAGRSREACATLGIRWEAEPAALVTSLPGLLWRDGRADYAALERAAAEDLAALDPVRLAAAFPRTVRGELLGNTTRFLRLYPGRAADSPGRRLALVAWTPGTSSYWARPADRGKRILTVGLELRSTYRPKSLLREEQWREPAPPAPH